MRTKRPSVLSTSKLGGACNRVQGATALSANCFLPLFLSILHEIGETLFLSAILSKVAHKS
jgi:hypothetical protein